jgi:hypothetical protein
VELLLARPIAQEEKELQEFTRQVREEKYSNPGVTELRQLIHGFPVVSNGREELVYALGKMKLALNNGAPNLTPLMMALDELIVKFIKFVNSHSHMERQFKALFEQVEQMQREQEVIKKLKVHPRTMTFAQLESLAAHHGFELIPDVTDEFEVPSE